MGEGHIQSTQRWRYHWEIRKEVVRGEEEMMTTGVPQHTEIKGIRR